MRTPGHTSPLLQAQSLDNAGQAPAPCADGYSLPTTPCTVPHTPLQLFHMIIHVRTCDLVFFARSPSQIHIYVLWSPHLLMRTIMQSSSSSSKAYALVLTCLSRVAQLVCRVPEPESFYIYKQPECFKACNRHLEIPMPGRESKCPPQIGHSPALCYRHTWDIFGGLDCPIANPTMHPENKTTAPIARRHVNIKNISRIQTETRSSPSQSKLSVES